MHGEHAIELGRHEVDEGRLVDMPGIVDEMRAGAQRLPATFDDMRDLGFDGDVAGDRDGIGADLGGNGPGCLLAKVIDDHAIAVTGQPLCDGPSDARACAGDDGDAHAMSSWIAARPARRTLA